MNFGNRHWLKDTNKDNKSRNNNPDFENSYSRQRKYGANPKDSYHNRTGKYKKGV